MEFQGDFELDGVSPEEAWIVLSDPVAVSRALQGCRYITEEDESFNFDTYEPDDDVETLPDADPDVVADRAFEAGKRYAALVQVGVGSVKPRFESHVNIDEREFPRMVASGSGSASSSTFTMTSGMEISETETGSKVDWWVETDVSGRIAQMGSRVLKPVANKVVSDFFGNIESQMKAVDDEGSSSVTDRLRNLI